MASLNAVGSWQWLLNELERARLLDREATRAAVRDFLVERPNADAHSLGEMLIRNGVITPYQLESVLAGNAIGLVVGPYVVVESCCKNHLGATLTAAHHADQRFVLMKQLPVGKSWNLSTARRTARGFADAPPASVVPLLDAGADGPISYLVWPHVAAETLQEIVTRRGPLSMARITTLIRDMATALQYLHRQQVWHGIISPMSIRIGSDGIARLMDLGLGSILAEGRLEPAGLPWPDCAPPESSLNVGHRSIRADQYALGCTLFFAATGRYPFSGRPAIHVIDAHRREPLPSVRSIRADSTVELDAIIARLTAKDPLERYGSPDELLNELLGLAPTDTHRTTITTRNQSGEPNREPRVSPMLREIRQRYGEQETHTPARLEQTPLPPALAPLPELPAVTARRTIAGRILDGFRAIRGAPQEVEVAILGPDRLLPGETALFQVVAFPSKLIDQSRRLSDWRGSLVLPRRLSRGATLSLHLGIANLTLGDGWRELLWAGESKTIAFKIQVPSDWPPGEALQGMLNLAADAVQAGKIHFRVPVIGKKTLAWK